MGKNASKRDTVRDQFAVAIIRLIMARGYTFEDPWWILLGLRNSPNEADQQALRHMAFDKCQKCAMQKLLMFFRNYRKDGVRVFQCVIPVAPRDEHNRRLNGKALARYKKQHPEIIEKRWVYVEGLTYKASIGQIPIDSVTSKLRHLIMWHQTRAHGEIDIAKAMTQVLERLEAAQKSGEPLEKPDLLIAAEQSYQPPLFAA